MMHMKACNLNILFDLNYKITLMFMDKLKIQN